MRSVRRQIKRLLTWYGTVVPDRAPGIYFLMYHAVTGQMEQELDIPPDLFVRQLEYLRQTGRIISYDEALVRLSRSAKLESEGYVLTFDDAYLDFYTTVYPRLADHGIPATLFVPTGFIEGEEDAHPMQRGGSAKPVTWDMLGEMAESGWVTLGAHSHTHVELQALPAEAVEEECRRSNDLFRRRLGVVPRHFAYPRTFRSDTAENVIRSHYDSAVIGGGIKAKQGCHPYRIPRVPILRADEWHFFTRKVSGALRKEAALYAALRRFRR